MGLVEPAWVSGNRDTYIMSSRRVPPTAAIFMPIPSIRAIPSRRNAAMITTSSTCTRAGASARKDKVSVLYVRKPSVGDPPFIIALADFVLKPRPNILSRKDQRNMNPSSILRMARGSKAPYDLTVFRADIRDESSF